MTLGKVEKVVHPKDGKDYRRYILIAYSSMVLLMLHSSIAPSSIIFYGWIFHGVTDEQSWKVTKILLPIIFGLHTIDVVSTYIGFRADSYATIYNEWREPPSDGDHSKREFFKSLEKIWKKYLARWQVIVTLLYEVAFSIGLGFYALFWLYSFEILPGTESPQEPTHVESSEPAHVESSEPAHMESPEPSADAPPIGRVIEGNFDDENIPDSECD